MNNRDRIKSKILESYPQKWWGDDFDARFFLISKVSVLQNKTILDLGGGIGIISDELDSSNIRFNLDISKKDLRFCLKNTRSKIHNICSIMEKIPFRSNSFDYIISGSVLQYAKNKDVANKQYYKKNRYYEYPSVEKTLSEINRVLKNNGKLFLVTPNNTYYKSYMLEYEELKHAIENHFSKYSMFFYNTFPILSRKYRKLNLANTIPKMLSKIKNPDSVIQYLIRKDNGKNKDSISFYVEAIKKG